MELYQLETFVVVAEEGRRSKGAKRLNTSQPAVSAHIKDLESELDVTLFHRSPKGMQLTRSGEQLLEKALAIIKAADELRYTAKSFDENPSGAVHLGLHTDPQLLRITDIFEELRCRYPRLSLSYLQRMSWQAAKDILSGKLDGAFVYATPEDPRISREVIESFKLAIIGPKKWQHRLENTTFEELATFPWVWAHEQCPLFHIADQLFSSHDREPLKTVIVEQETAIIQFVSEGVGYSRIVKMILWLKLP